jgi:hypothetical protein
VNADLKKWVEEKTHGKAKASDVISLSLSDIRVGGPGVVSEKLKACKPGSYCVVNAASYRDLEVFVMGVMLAEKTGKKFLYRTRQLLPLRRSDLGKKFSTKEHTTTQKDRRDCGISRPKLRASSHGYSLMARSRR